jgi:hypothetical protein
MASGMLLSLGIINFAYFAQNDMLKRGSGALGNLATGGCVLATAAISDF